MQSNPITKLPLFAACNIKPTAANSTSLASKTPENPEIDHYVACKPSHASSTLLKTDAAPQSSGGLRDISNGLLQQRLSQPASTPFAHDSHSLEQVKLA